MFLGTLPSELCALEKQDDALCDSTGNSTEGCVWIVDTSGSLDSTITDPRGVCKAAAHGGKAGTQKGLGASPATLQSREVTHWDSAVAS